MLGRARPAGRRKKYFKLPIRKLPIRAGLGEHDVIDGRGGTICYVVDPAMISCMAAWAMIGCLATLAMMCSAVARAMTG
jgi:hypothetical protein